MDNHGIGQEFLPFKLGVTEETITSLSGLALFHEATLASGVVAQTRKRLSTPCSNRGISPEDYVMPLAPMLTGGGQCRRTSGRFNRTPASEKSVASVTYPEPTPSVSGSRYPTASWEQSMSTST